MRAMEINKLLKLINEFSMIARQNSNTRSIAFFNINKILANITQQ